MDPAPPSGIISAMKLPKTDPAFERALSREILASEQMRARVLAGVLALLLVLDQLLFLVDPGAVRQLLREPVPAWLPLRIIGPFLAYEIVVLMALRYRIARGKDLPGAIRLLNVVIETSLPTVILWWVSQYAGPAVAFGSWPSMLYFLFVVASTLRLDFMLPLLTGAVAAAGYLGLVYVVLPLNAPPTDPALAPLYHLTRAAIMLIAGLVAGLVSLRLREKFGLAVAEAASRERVTNIFGQHVSPAVVERLIDRPTDFTGERQEICVMFLDIRNFTANARRRAPEEVVAFLNAAFAFMIEAVDRHQGFVNKFLGDGFMAIFGAPLEDPAAARNGVAAAREILNEIDRRGLAEAAWPLKVGIGLHLGTAVTGNIGSPRRKEFTAIGDTVNLAARLEQLTKECGARLIVSEEVMAALSDTAGAAQPLDGVTLKGYALPLRAWRLS
ncbi:MAG TPA: adenylate/guanylate cyclase domain-containing protein [Stellaceae bacterium]|nr:adenylate/guanylate cyclase domain-containing protein [Stellaceae bacterium]